MLRMQARAVLREGLVLGLIGAGSVAGWFLLVDVIRGRPFFTPAVLGSVAFLGLKDAASVSIDMQPVLAYTAFHVVAFLVAGIIIAAIMAEARKDAHVLWLLAEFFIVFEFGFYAAVGLAFRPALAELTWVNVGVGTSSRPGGLVSTCGGRTRGYPFERGWPWGVLACGRSGRQFGGRSQSTTSWAE